MRPLQKVLLVVALIAGGFGVWVTGMLLWDDPPVSPKLLPYKVCKVCTGVAGLMILAGVGCMTIPPAPESLGPEGAEDGAVLDHFLPEDWIRSRSSARASASTSSSPPAAAAAARPASAGRSPSSRSEPERRAGWGAR